MTYKYKRRAQYHETDQMGIIHHSNYIKWFEEARISWMNSIGVSYKEMEEEGIQIPVLSISCDYVAMLKFDDEIIVNVKVKNYNGIRFELTYEVKDKTEKQLYAKGTSKHCFVSKDKKLLSLKKSNKAMHMIFEQSTN